MPIIAAKIYPEFVTKSGSVRVSRKASQGEMDRMECGGVELTRKSTKSDLSLSAELVEAAMHDGQYRFLNERAHEAAIWCGLISFVLMSVGLIVLGLTMALK